MPGLTWYGTPSHGGLAVSKSLALKNLSPMAREQANVQGNNYFFEEDVAYNIPFYENPQWAKLMNKASPGYPLPSKQTMEQSIKTWFPEYFDEDKKKNVESKPELTKLQKGDIIKTSVGKDFRILGQYKNRKDMSVEYIKRGKISRIGESYYKEYAVEIVRRGKTIWKKV